MAEKPQFHFEVGDDCYLTVDEIWPNGDAPENPTTEDVIAHVKATTTKSRFASEWGFDTYVSVNGKDVFG